MFTSKDMNTMMNAIPHDVKCSSTFDPLIDGVHFSIRHQAVRIAGYHPIHGRVQKR